MSAHLRDTEFVDLLEETLRADRAEHVDTCRECREKADALRITLSAVDEDRVPEPSPLFWEHFSARVRTAVAKESVPGRWWRNALSAPAVRWSALGTAALLVLAVALWRAGAPSSDVAIRSADMAEETAVVSASAEHASEDIENDEAWALVRTVADELEEAEIKDAGIAARPGSVERIANALSEMERVQLAELIEREINGS